MIIPCNARVTCPRRVSLRPCPRCSRSTPVSPVAAAPQSPLSTARSQPEGLRRGLSASMARSRRLPRSGRQPLSAGLQQRRVCCRCAALASSSARSPEFGRAFRRPTAGNVPGAAGGEQTGIHRSPRVPREPGYRRHSNRLHSARSGDVGAHTEAESRGSARDTDESEDKGPLPPGDRGAPRKARAPPRSACIRGVARQTEQLFTLQ